MSEKEDVQQFDLKEIMRSKMPDMANTIPNWTYKLIAKAMSLKQINKFLLLYGHKKGIDFADALMSYTTRPMEVYGLDRVPLEGRYIFASNHYLGGLDGVGLISVLGKRFKNIKVLVNDILMLIESLCSVFLPINKHGGQGKSSVDMINDSLASDDQIAIFPSGFVARRQGNELKELAWRKFFIVKAIQYQRDVVPIYFDAHNSKFFYNFSKWRVKLGIKVNIDMFFLPREIFNKQNDQFKIYIGAPIKWQTFDSSRSHSEWAEWVKEQAMSLKP